MKKRDNPPMKKPKTWDIRASQTARAVLVSSPLSINDISRVGLVGSKTIERIIVGFVVREKTANLAIEAARRAMRIR